MYMGIPNLIMVRYKGRPPLPLDEYAMSLRGLRQVIWSAVGAHGQTDQDERAHVLDLATRESNIRGIILDDFFIDKPTPNAEPTALSLVQLRELRQQLSRGVRRLDLWAVLYAHQLDQRLVPYLNLVDVVTLWAWDVEQFRNMEIALARLEALVPSCQKVLGCYMWDYGSRRPMNLDAFQAQCDMGLHWLRQGRIHGMIFLASCLCDLGLEAVEWARSWIGQVGGFPL
jgi:hypothetical protein